VRLLRWSRAAGATEMREVPNVGSARGAPADGQFGPRGARQRWYDARVARMMYDGEELCG
jgi:hypothetical protein